MCNPALFLCLNMNKKIGFSRRHDTKEQIVILKYYKKASNLELLVLVNDIIFEKYTYRKLSALSIK